MENDQNRKGHVTRSRNVCDIPVRGFRMKLPNRRVAVYDLRGTKAEGDFGLEFKTLTKDRTILETRLSLSSEAFRALFACWVNLQLGEESPNL